MPSPAELVRGKYRLAERIGTGASSVVHAAVHAGTGREVAIKLLAPGRGDAATLAARFEREARAAGTVSSPHVVAVLDVDRDDEGAPFIVLERLRGETLEALLDKRSRLPATLAAEIARQALSGLADLHAAGIVHRDLKPANVFLVEREDKKTWVKLVDLGIAKVSQASLDEEITRTDEALGTLSFMSPEQIKRAEVGPASDVWSAGVLLYRMLTGRSPFFANDPMSLVAVILEKPAARLPEGLPCGAALQAVIDRALAKTASDRYATATEMRRAIASAMGEDLEEPVVAAAAAAMPMPRAPMASELRETLELPKPSVPEEAAAGARTSTSTSRRTRTRTRTEVLVAVGVGAIVGWIAMGTARRAPAAERVVIHVVPPPRSETSATPAAAATTAVVDLDDVPITATTSDRPRATSKRTGPAPSTSASSHKPRVMLDPPY